MTEADDTRCEVNQVIDGRRSLKLKNSFHLGSIPLEHTFSRGARPVGQRRTTPSHIHADSKGCLLYVQAIYYIISGEYLLVHYTLLERQEGAKKGYV
jgi:hypothetical protein